MAECKRRVLTLSTGKQIKLYGNSIAIGRSLEIGEGAAPNIFSEGVQHTPEINGGNHPPKISNPYKLTPEEIHELADYNIRLWMDLKDAIRKYGVDNVKIFSQEKSN